MSVVRIARPSQSEIGSMKAILTMTAMWAAVLATSHAQALDTNAAKSAADAYYAAWDRGDMPKLTVMHASMLPPMARDANAFGKSLKMQEETNGKRVSRKFVRVAPGKAPQVAMVLSESRFERTGLAVERLQLIEESPGNVKIVANSIMKCEATCEAALRMPTGGSKTDDDKEE